MSWNRQKSADRIRKLMSSVPVAGIELYDFARDYLPQRARFLAESRGAGLRGLNNPILALPYNRAVLTHGVHVYANLMEINDQLVENGAETEASQKRAFQFLHLHYGACDRLIEAFELQRVDFHGGRLHAVVLTPAGAAGERERVVKAVAFAAAFRDMVAENNGRFGGRYQTRVRVGIDTGPAVAINSGKKGEPEPLFLGSPANHAAHLAMGSEEGVSLSIAARQTLSNSVAPAPRHSTRMMDADERRLVQEAAQFTAAAGGRLNVRVEAALRDYANEIRERELAEGEPAVFHFHHHSPPLKSVDFAELPPSNAVRMELASIFADLDGFTDYVDTAITSGQVPQLVANLHVLRGEFAATLRDDFLGRKIRFVGDALHGLIAEGSSVSTDGAKTVTTALLAAGGVRSSFDLCRGLLPGVGTLGLAIGVEYGWTPICRIGLRGDSSVRCAASRATCESEREQQECSEVETAIGETAYKTGTIAVRRAFGHARKLPNLDYPAAVALFQGVSAPAVSRTAAEPFRAHLKHG